MKNAPGVRREERREWRTLAANRLGGSAPSSPISGARPVNAHSGPPRRRIGCICRSPAVLIANRLPSSIRAHNFANRRPPFSGASARVFRGRQNWGCDESVVSAPALAPVPAHLAFVAFTRPAQLAFVAFNRTAQLVFIAFDRLAQSAFIAVTRLAQLAFTAFTRLAQLALVAFNRSAQSAFAARSLALRSAMPN